MKGRDKFSIIFDELAKDENQISISSFTSDAEASREESEEISELRNIVCEISEGEPFVYTST